MKKTKLKPFTVFLATTLLLTTAHAGEFKGTATIHFKGTSTLHEFEGTVNAAPFPATFVEDKKTGQFRVTASASVAILEMDTQNKTRDKKMFKMFESKKFPKIYGSLKNAVIPLEGSGKAVLRLKIHGIEQDVPVTLSDVKHDDHQATCRMVFSISLKAFGLKPPSVMGLIRVGDTVEIECLVQGTLK